MYERGGEGGEIVYERGWGRVFINYGQCWVGLSKGDG